MAALALTTENFEDTIKSGKTLVDFWATWCGPCQMQGPVIEEFADKHTDIKVGKVNVDDQMALASKYQVMNIPTLAIFEDGELKNKMVGFHSMEELEAALS